MKRRQSGFTLLEVLVVLVVTAILAAIAVITLFGAVDRAKQRATMADMRTISHAMEAYEVDNSALPNPSGGLAALIPVLIPFATSVLPVSDHWGHRYSYTSDGFNYTIESWGKDGVNGANMTPTTKMDFTTDIVVYNGSFTASPE